MSRHGGRRSSARAVAGLAIALSLISGAAVRGQARKWPSESAPRPLPMREVTFPPYQFRSLPNGLRVIVVAHGEQPAVTLRLVVEAGAAQDPPGKAGLAALAAALLDQGTDTKRAQEVADAIDSIGGQIETGVGRDLTFADLVVMTPDAGVGLDLLAEIVRHTAFAPEEIERQRQQVLAGLKVGAEDPKYLADVAIERLVYGFSPYGLPGNGTPESVAAIGRDDLLAFHARYFAPNNAILAVVGDVGAEDAFTAVERAFGGWPRKALPAAAPVDPPPPTRRVVVIDKPDAVQTEIRVGQLATPRKQPGFRALDLASRILGGEGANRLYRVLRSERGLTYGASADLEPLKYSGKLVVRTNTRSETTAEALGLIIDEFARLRRERVDERELADAKTYLTGSYLLSIETPNQMATSLLDHVFYELPLGDLDNYRAHVSAVSVDQIARVVWETLRPDRLSIALVGNAAAFAGDLRGVGLGRFERVPAGELDLMAADFRRK